VLTHKAVGYAILAGLTSAHSLVELRRLVVAEKNRGYCSGALELIKRFAFGELGFHSLWLDTKTYNEKAKNCMKAAGSGKREASASAYSWPAGIIRWRGSPYWKAIESILYSLP